ncbi:MAG TPA: hypothetical protein PK431_01595 [Chitinophagales bacterium]|nr:hypothetical protein [Chitinophagales bacterium]
MKEDVRNSPYEFVKKYFSKQAEKYERIKWKNIEYVFCGEKLNVIPLPYPTYTSKRRLPRKLKKLLNNNSNKPLTNSPFSSAFKIDLTKEELFKFKQLVEQYSK